MIHECSEPFKGNTPKAIEFIGAALTGAGFRIESRGEGNLRAEGPRWSAANVKSNPLGGVSRIEISASGASLIAKADSRPLEKICKIAMLAISLSLAAMTVLAFAMRGPMPFVVRLGITDGPVLTGLIVVPFARSTANWRIREGLQTLLHNAAMVSG